MSTLPPTKILDLANGRQLSYSLYGDPVGLPVYYMHGFYGSRFEAALAADAAAAAGIRLIAADRPGVGHSTPEPDRTLASWSTVIKELADHLGHHRFGLLGVSGGGPYALACAKGLDDRISALALCGSLAPLQASPQLPRNYRLALWANRNCHPLLKLVNTLLFLGARFCPRLLLQLVSSRLSETDRKTLKKPSVLRILRYSLTAASAQTPLFGEQDLTIFGSDWTDMLHPATVPTTIWHGDADSIVPVALGHQLSTALPQAKLNVVAAAGHFSLPIEHAFDIFTTLRRDAESHY